MSIEMQIKNLMAAFQKTAYFRWMKGGGFTDAPAIRIADGPDLTGKVPLEKVQFFCSVSRHGKECLP